MSDVTALIERCAAGDRSATPELFEVVYGELRQLAAAFMRREGKADTIQATALVNEAYCRLVGDEVAWEGRAHFFGVAARVMRRVLIEHARARKAAKRGGGITGLALDEALHAAGSESGVDVVDMLALDRALEGLARINPRAVRVVELRFFAGLSMDETTELLQASSGTVKRDWAFAQAFLRRHMDGDGGAS